MELLVDRLVNRSEANQQGETSLKELLTALSLHEALCWINPFGVMYCSREQN